jgi:lysophospholipase L1-like esterase
MVRALTTVWAAWWSFSLVVVAPAPVVNADPGAEEPMGRQLPRSVAVIGDSISQGTGSDGPGAPGGGIGEPRLAASWATGDQRGLDSYADRLDAIATTAVQRFNLSANGASMRNDFFDQITRVGTDVDLVLIQMGGNDLCRQSEEDITTPEDFEAAFARGLDWLAEHRPDTLILVGSVPDIYSLWYVRGAPHVGEQWPLLDLFLPGGAGPRPARTSEENDNKRWARLLWNTLGMVPCATMLDAANRPRSAGPTPDSTDPAEARRLRVRAINQRYNEILADRCGAMVRCRFDGGAVFDLMANRDRTGELLGDPARWTFTDADISTQDHFHPSFQGQVKLAEAMWESGFDFVDTTAPTVQLQYPGVGTFTGAVSYLDGERRLRALAADDRGVRGIEYRSAPAGGDLSTRRWQSVLGSSLDIDIASDTDLEVRAIDINGNVSASATTRFMLDTEPPSVAIALVGIDAVDPDDGTGSGGGGGEDGEDGVSVFGGPRGASVSSAGEVTTGSVPHHHLDGPLAMLNAPVTAIASCADTESGVVHCGLDGGERRQMIDTSPVGAHRVSAEAVDRVGNRAETTVGYRVVYGWESPWMSPLNPGDDRTPGRVVMVRLGLLDAFDTAVSDASVTLRLIDSAGEPRPVPSPLAAIGLDGLVWSEQLGEYLAVVGTTTLSPGRWTLVLEADDGGRLEWPITIG